MPTMAGSGIDEAGRPSETPPMKTTPSRPSRSVVTKGMKKMAAAPRRFCASGEKSSLVRVMSERFAGGADVDARQRHGYTPLHAAAQNGDVELLELLLSAGANPSVAKDDGETPAQTAEAAGHADVARRLREVAAAR